MGNIQLFRNCKEEKEMLWLNAKTKLETNSLKLRFTVSVLIFLKEKQKWTKSSLP